MKKFLLMPVLMLALLTGCSSGGKDTTTVCTLNKSQTGITMDAKDTLTANGDELTKQQSHLDITVDDATLKSSGKSMDDFSKAFDSEFASYKKVKGVTVKSEVKDNKVLIDVTIDYSKASLDDLKSAGLVTFSGDSDSKIKYVSLKETVSNLESADQGYKCKESK